MPSAAKLQNQRRAGIARGNPARTSLHSGNRPGCVNNVFRFSHRTEDFKSMKGIFKARSYMLLSVTVITWNRKQPLHFKESDSILFIFAPDILMAPAKKVHLL